MVNVVEHRCKRAIRNEFGIAIPGRYEMGPIHERHPKHMPGSRKNWRQKRAEERAQRYENRSPKGQLKLIAKRRGNSAKETARLKAMIA